MRPKKELATFENVRNMLTFLENHPDIPMPVIGRYNAFEYTADKLGEYAREMAPVAKSLDDNYFTLTRSFGDVRLAVHFGRADVCEAVVVGTEEVPERVVPAYTRNIVEWKCPESILAP